MAPKKRALSQPAAHNQSTNSRYSSTQPNIQECLRGITNITNDELNEQANECVRLLIYRVGQQLPIRKNDLQKHIKGLVGRNFDRVLQIASNTLEKVYGFKLILCDGGSKFYILSNNLSHLEEDKYENEPLSEVPADCRKILLLLVLIHLYMSPNSVSQASLFSFLKSLLIDPDQKHEVFGDVKEYITVTLVKQHYIHAEKDDISQQISYSWGERAEKEISKMEILELVCKIFGNNNSKSWVTQYKEAKDQPLENHRNANVMEEDTNDE